MWTYNSSIRLLNITSLSEKILVNYLQASTSKEDMKMLKIEYKIKRMDLISKLYQKSVIERIKEMIFNEDVFPLVVEFDPTTACNYSCQGCISTDLLRKGGFSSTRLLEIAHELGKAGIMAVILIGGGEPLMHPKIADFIKILRYEYDISLGLTTNGYFIDKYLDLIAENMFWTRVSVDAGVEETYNKLRPTLNGLSGFRKVIRNMEMLAKRKKGLLGYSFLVRYEGDLLENKNTNINEIYEACRIAKEIGCDYFEIKPLYNLNHHLVLIDEKFVPKIKEQIERCEELVDENFKVIKAVNLDFAIEGKSPFQPKDYTSCPIAKLRTLITPHGVYVCPYFRGNSKFKLGDVKDITFDKMWKSSQKKEVLNRLNPSKDCTFYCLRDLSIKEIFKIISILKSGEKIEVKEDRDLFI